MSILDAAGMSWICSRQGCDAAAISASFRAANLGIRGLSSPPRNFPRYIRTESRSIACSASFGRSLVRKMLNRCCVVSHDDDTEFLPWLRAKSGQEISSMLTIGRSAYGRSLFSSRSISAGERILSVPHKVLLTPEDIPSLLKPLISDEVSDLGRLAIVLLAERKSSQGSDWAPYISRLPCIDDMHNLILWSDDELDMLRPSLIYHEALDKKGCIEKEFSTLKTVLESFSETFGHVSLKSFLHACALVGSRAWATSSSISLIPFADFLNHDGNSEDVLTSDEENQTSEILAARDYAAGEEILIRYGKFSNAALLLDFGFTIRENVYDEVNILMEVPRYDPLYQTKLDLLKRHGIQITGKFTDIYSSEGYFTIKEVRSINESGKGIPVTLRAFARVLTAKSRDDLEEMCIEAYEHDGRLARRPLGIKEREIEAHRILLSKISLMIENYSNSLQIDFLSKSGTRDRRPCRINMARDLLSGELRVLKSARSWLENYCSA